MDRVFLVLLFGFGENPLGFIIAISLLLVLARMLFGILGDGIRLAKSRQANSGDMTYDPERESAVRFHLSTFLYFRKLTAQGKTEFVHRTLNFMETHSVAGESDYEPGLPAKIHVAAAATQLTFGLDDFAFTHFETILLYPGIFRMHEGGPLMKGATTPNGVIRISIRDFNAGYENPSDKLNVGLHEFGHALFMEFLKAATEDEDEELKNKIYPYLATSDKMLNAGKHNDNFLRDYAFTNRHEFFAVSVEHFFEASKEFKEKLPELYELLKNLLKQDPAGEMVDYGILRQNKI
jgi:Mlc titration factor MtfA (ptsG expression regulator)